MHLPALAPTLTKSMITSSRPGSRTSCGAACRMTICCARRRRRDLEIPWASQSTCECAHTFAADINLLVSRWARRRHGEGTGDVDVINIELAPAIGIQLFA